MKRSSSIPAALLVVVLASGAFAGEWDSVRAKLRGGRDVTLAAIGDSITFLCGHTDFRRNCLTFVADALQKTYPDSCGKSRVSISRLCKSKNDMLFNSNNRGK